MKIVNNYEYNSIELYFDGKPDEMTRETLKMFKWRWNPKKFCWYNKNTAENMALAESLNKSADEMKEKKISDKYMKKDAEPVMDVKAFVDNLFKVDETQEKNILKVMSQAEKKPKNISVSAQYSNARFSITLASVC